MLLRHKHGSKQKTQHHIYNTKMGSNNELKEIDIKNSLCYYFDDIITNDLDLDILLDGKS